MKRHKCVKCGAKRFERFMRRLNRYCSNGGSLWECSDDFCGDALSKMHGLSKPLSSLQRGQPRAFECCCPKEGWCSWCKKHPDVPKATHDSNKKEVSS